MTTRRRGRFIAGAFVLVIICAAAATKCCWAQGDDAPPADVLSMSTTWQGPNPQFVTTMLADNSGWWWGTDNDGLWHFAAGAKIGHRWLHFRAEDGLYDDSITALCIDRHGRLWVGTERRGIDVYNGIWWQNYSILQGPLGVHVASIALNPLNGDVWIASEAGLSIYSDRTKSWSYKSTENGLVTNEINCIAFTRNGTAILGSAHNGLLLATPADSYKTWTNIVSSPIASVTEIGSGLPDNQINCLLVNPAGKIYCGTSEGVAVSSDNAATFTYLHGYGWAMSVKTAVRRTQAIDRDNSQIPLMENYVSALACDQAGHVFIGHRKSGLEIYDDVNGQPLYHSQYYAYGVYIKALLFVAPGSLLVGNYGSGVSRQSWQPATSSAATNPPNLGGYLLFPAAAAPPDVAELQKMEIGVKKPLAIAGIHDLLKKNGPVVSYFLDEDWQTQGDWIGRYGSEYAVLCGENGNEDLVLSSDPSFSVVAGVGEDYSGQTDASHWVQWPVSYDPRVLYDPLIGTRRESEWDDRGEQYDRLREGPDLWLTVTVPAGIHRLALYFMNKDGHTALTRYRDFIVQLKQDVSGVDIRDSYADDTLLPVIAEKRVENFWPGVYENFVVIGPGSYYVKVDKNFSLNTIVQGVFLDRLGSEAGAGTEPWMHGVSFGPMIPKSPQYDPTGDYAASAKRPSVQQIEKVWSDLDLLYGNVDSSCIQRQDRILLLRAAEAIHAPAALIAQWTWELRLWGGDDWSNFDKATHRLGTIRIKSAT